MAEIANAYVSLLPSLRGFHKSLAPTMRKSGEDAGKEWGDGFYRDSNGRLRDANNRFVKESEEAGERAGKAAGGRMSTALKGAVFGALAAVSVGALASEIGAASDATDKFRSTLEFAGFKPKGVEAATKAAQAYADATVYELSDIQGSMATLASNGVKDYQGLTEAAGNLNAVAGGNVETFKSVTQMLGQTAGAGKLSTENWNQLADAIPGASGPLQEALQKAGAFTGNFRDAMAKGEITADEFNTALLELGSKPVAAEAATSTTTFEGALGNLKATVVGALLPAVDRIKPAVTAALSGAADLIPRIVQGFKNLVGWIRQNADWLAPLAGAILAAAAAFVAWRIAVSAWSAATRIAAAAQAAMNVVMAANPIGIVVLAIAALVGALVVLYKRNETVRRIIDAAWAGIKKAVSAVADWWTQTAWPAIRTAINAMGNWFRDTGRTISNVWGAIRSAIGVAWAWIHAHVFAPIRKGIEFVGLVFKANQLVISTVWSRIKDALGAGWRWVREHVFTPFRRGLDVLGEAFDKTKDFIARAWGKVKKAAAVPINFVIETVYMNGIKKTWDKIADAVGLDLALPTVNPIKFARGGVLPGYTPGRDVHEFFSPTGGRLSLSGGEAIMRPEFTRAVGGPAGVARLNSAARSGQAFADGGVWDWAGDAWSTVKNAVSKFLSDPAGAIGDLIGGQVRSMLGSVGGGGIGKIAARLPTKIVSGLIDRVKGLASTALPTGGKAGPAMGWQNQWNLIRSAFPNAALTSAFRPGAITAVGTPSYHGQGRAIDVSPSMAIFNWIAKNFPNSTELIYSPAGGRQLYKGQQTLFGEPTRGDHWDHVHWAMKNGGVLPKLYDQGGWLPSGGLGVNQTGKPEAVLTPDESRALKSGLNQRPVSLTFNTTRVTSRDVVHGLNVADLLDAGVTQ